MHICRRVLCGSPTACLLYMCGSMSVENLIFKIFPLFSSRCLRFVVEISEYVLVFLKSIMGALNYAQIVVFKGCTLYSVIVCTAWHKSQKTAI